MIALNIFYAKKEKIYLAYVSRHNPSRERQVVRFMIPNGGRWHYITVKALPTSVREISSKHRIDFYCLNCLHSCRTENKLKSHKNKNM